MRTRKVLAMSLLVLVILSMAVIPAQAEPPQTEFTATVLSTVELYDPECRITGDATHCTNRFMSVIDSPDPRFRGDMVLTAVCSGPGVNHPQAVYVPEWDITIGWGPCIAVWRLEVTADSGWEGQDPGSPQADYRNAKLGNATGVGYGDFKGMTVKWVQHDGMDWVNGLLYVTIKQDK